MNLTTLSSVKTMAARRTLTKLLRAIFPNEDLGWKEIGETFVRYTLMKTPWFRLYLHEVRAFNPHPHYHTHPWNFYTFILYGGYYEKTPTTDWTDIKTGTLHYHPHDFAHNVITGAVSWSLVLTGPKKWEWGFVPPNPEDCFPPYLTRS